MTNPREGVFFYQIHFKFAFLGLYKKQLQNF